MNKRIKTASAWIVMGISVWFMVVWQQKCIERWKEQAEKNKAMFLLMSQWLNLRQNGKNLEEYFLRNGYKQVAIYGMGIMGQQMVKELKASEIEVKYGLDRNKNIIYPDLKILTMEDNLPAVDAVVVMVVKEFDTIKETLLKRIDCSVLAIEDILDEF